MSFPTKYTVPEETDTLTDARAAVAKLEAEHRARGLHLSGRIIHVVHYLPIVSTLRTKADDPLISPPKTPEAADIVTLETTRSNAREYFLDSLVRSRTRRLLVDCAPMIYRADPCCPNITYLTPVRAQVPQSSSSPPTTTIHNPQPHLPCFPRTDRMLPCQRRSTNLEGGS